MVNVITPNSSFCQAMTELTSEAKAFIHVLPQADLLQMAGAKEHFDSAQGFVQVAHVTNCEAMLSQALARPDSKQLRDRLRSFTACCSDAIGDDWALHVHSELVSLARQHFGMPAQPAKPERQRKRQKTMATS